MFLDFRHILNPEDRRCKNFAGAEDWDEMKTKMSSRMVLRGASYDPLRLFDVKPVEMAATRVSQMQPGTHVVSPSGNFRYTEVILPAGEWITVAQGNRRGDVCFDEDVAVPRLNAANDHIIRENNQRSGFKDRPWMSITPMEILTQRPGLRRAKGHTVVAGLGMGWLLRQVALKKSVKKITLVEVSQELIDWVLPSLALTKDVDVICGDARTVLPDMEADVALVDIWMDYGGNSFKKCPGIDYVWCWGSQYCC